MFSSHFISRTGNYRLGALWCNRAFPRLITDGKHMCSQHTGEIVQEHFLLEEGFPLYLCQQNTANGRNCRQKRSQKFAQTAGPGKDVPAIPDDPTPAGRTSDGTPQTQRMPLVGTWTSQPGKITRAGGTRRQLLGAGETRGTEKESTWLNANTIRPKVVQVWKELTSRSISSTQWHQIADLGVMPSWDLPGSQYSFPAVPPPN